MMAELTSIIDEPGVKQADTIQEMMKAKATPEEIKGSLVTVNKIGKRIWSECYKRKLT